MIADSDNPIVDKSFEFAVRIVNLSKFLREEKREFVMSKQLLRCRTSIGANVFEGQRAQSRADFHAKMCIALKEANETFFWLKLLYRTDYLSEIQFRSMLRELDEIMRLLTAICKSTSSG